MSVPDVIGVTGYAQSGKDTVGKYLRQVWGFERVAFADAVRDAVEMMNPYVLRDSRLDIVLEEYGWDRAKVEFPETRRLLQVMGTEVGRMLFGENVWVDIAARKMEGLDRVVITDVRFPNEADFIRSRGGIVVRIERPGVEPVNTHSSEALAFESDHVLLNASDLSSLYDEVDSLLDSYA